MAKKIVCYNVDTEYMSILILLDQKKNKDNVIEEKKH